MGNDLGRIDPRELDRFITRDDDRAECPDCEGTGYRIYSDLIGKRPDNGLMDDGRRHCPRCDGSGSIGK